MKKHFYIAAATVVALFTSSCDKEFLEKTPTQFVTPEQISAAALEDPTLLNSFVSGLYSTMFNTATGGTTSHEDFGQKGYDIYSDMLVSDMVLGGETYGYYTATARYQATTNFTLNDTYRPWRYYYRIIFSANTLIDILGGTDATPATPALKHAMGQAKAMRAYAYFYLAQFYSKGYGDGTEKILPIYVNTTAPGQPKSTSADVYNLIVSDLTQAITLMEGFTRTAKNQLNASVMKGLLAYALAARGTQADLQQVVTLTDDVIANGGFRLMAANEVVAMFDAGVINNRTTAGFNNVANPSWMWGMDLTLDNGLNLISWWGQIDLFTYSYAWAGDQKRIDRALYDKIPATDIRKGQFTTNANYSLMPINKFFDPARTIGGQRQVVTDYIYMRLEEMYLLNAEAKAKLGQEAAARTRLKEMLANRMPTTLYIDALSGQALLDEIFLQTRIELWGEGKSYLSMKRNKLTVTRGSNHLFGTAGKSYAWDSDEMTYDIPQAEVINNPVLNL